MSYNCRCKLEWHNVKMNKKDLKQLKNRNN